MSHRAGFDVPQTRRPRVHVDAERCAGCGECVDRCPTAALWLDATGVVAADPALCVGCRQCERTCPFRAIRVEGPLLVEPRMAPAPLRPVRLMDDREAEEGIESLGAAVREALRCLHCPDPTCVLGCPAHNDIPGFIAAICELDLDHARSILASSSVMPEVCSRTCDAFALCEGACSLALAGGEAVSIRLLERFVTDHTAAPPLPVRSTRAKRLSVAVVGSGPAGLAAAGELMSRGAHVVVFEREPQPLGALRWAIPAFVLPDEVADLSLERLLEAGLELRTGIAVRGGDIPALLSIHDAVILAHGATVPGAATVSGANLGGVETAERFLARAKVALATNRPLEDVRAGARVLVVGGGGTAMDVARSVRRLGGEAVVADPRDERTAASGREKLRAALAEGVRVRYETDVVRLTGERGVVAQAWLARRRRLGVPRPAPEAVDHVVLVTGAFVDPEPARGLLATLPVPLESLPDAADWRWVTSGLMAGHTAAARGRDAERILERAALPVGAGVWAAGDALAGPGTVVEAMAQGRRAGEGVLAAMPVRTDPTGLRVLTTGKEFVAAVDED